MKIDYTNLSFTQLIDKIESNRFFDIPRMVREAFTRLLTRVEDLETPPYKVYTALLTQSGTDAPVATVLENTLGEDVVFIYNNTGIFNTSNTFDSTKTSVIVGTLNTGGNDIIQSYIETNIVEIYTATQSVNVEGDLINTPTNGLLSDVYLEIRVYN